MQISGLGEVTRNSDLDCYVSKAIPVALFGGKMCQIAVRGYDDDSHKDDFHTAIANFLSLHNAALRDAEPYVFQYYQDMNGDWQPGDDGFVAIESPSDVWEHVQFGSRPVFERRAYRDKRVYVDLECECDWEPEHGLQLILKEGRKVSKVGPYDGHLTNSDAYGNDSLENVVYVRRGWTAG